jgi:hypothetical protein
MPYKNFAVQIHPLNLYNTVGSTGVSSERKCNHTGGGGYQEMSDSSPVKTQQDKLQHDAHRNSEQEVQQSERDLISFWGDYIEAKWKIARDTRGRPPWWNRNN